MTNIKFSKELIEKVPMTRLGCIQCSVEIKPSDNKIKSLSDDIIKSIKAALTIKTVSNKPTIKATKEAYRKLGKDPSRYRPSAEALTRRVVNGKGLFWINNIVDILNLISLESGFSIGGYDVSKIKGEATFGVGSKDEPYQAIGRGELNIENLPLFRDEMGPFGSPTSDSLRTMVTDRTTKFLMIIIDFNGDEMLKKTMKRSVELYQQFADVGHLDTQLITTIGK